MAPAKPQRVITFTIGKLEKQKVVAKKKVAAKKKVDVKKTAVKKAVKKK
jgi:hypothetical protein